MPIHVLAPDVVDRIAAGEVLDRPANLIKELVENSLDAGATSIEIEFQGGGREVLVSDNGRGMAREDLSLAVQRHATSKISKSEDLFQLHSFGFRGEALASIASVSRLILTSRLKGTEQGHRIQSEFGHLSAPAPVSTREGTEIRVQELFANVPARLKFLKSEAAEHSAIKSAIKALGLAHPQVGFSVRSNNELIFHWPAEQSALDRAQLILGMKSLFEGGDEVAGIRADVLLSSPQDTLNVNRGMWFFVQGRWIQDRSLTASVMEGYRNLLMHGEYPTVVVRLTLSPEEVDVNVHPTKSQVKFRDPQSAFRVTCRAIRAVLEKSPWLNNDERPFVLNATESAEFFPVREEAVAGLKFSAPEFERTQYAKKSFPIAQTRAAVGAAETTEPSSQFRWADLQVIGQLNHTYIMAQTQDAFYMVDQHAAHERVVFERLMESFKSGNIDVQNLLLPLVFDFSVEEVETLLKHRDAVERIGLSIERMGPESLAVQAIPTVVTESAISQALHRLASELSENRGEGALENAVGEVFASMACHSVIRAGQSMSSEEMSSLLKQMDQYPLSSFCPHGRPVYVKRRFTEIEREFGRIV